MTLKQIVVSLAVALLFAPTSNTKTLSVEIEKTQLKSTEEHIEHLLQQTKTIPVNLAFSQSPYIYTSQFSFGSNR